jgi:hypothetical protein
MRGNTTSSDSGAIGDARGVVQNVAPVRDREEINLGAILGADGTADWVVFNTDTINLTTDLDRRLGKTSLEFDKTDGLANTKFAGVYRDGLRWDFSRFLIDGVMNLGIQVSALTNVDKVHVRLGTDASNYQVWTWDDSDLVAAAWNDLSRSIKDCTVVANGWNPALVKYAAILVEFDAETDALADILVDYCAMTEGYMANAVLNGVNLDSVTAATNGNAVLTRDTIEVTVYVAVSGNTGAVTVNIEHSPDGSAWYALDSKTYTATNDTDDWSYLSHFPYMRTTSTTHANATVKTTITGKLR